MIGAQTRAALGIPRVTVVTVRRRVLPLVAGRMNELIVPTTALLVAPLRRRRNSRGRLK